MNHLILAMIGLLLLASCEAQPKSHLQDGDSTGARTKGTIKSQEAIAKDIVSIERAFGDAVIRVDNTNDATAFAAKVESWVNRLDQISKELDTLGSFSAVPN